MKNKLAKKGGSGIYLNANDKEAFEHFVNNSTAHFNRTGSFGITYILRLNPGVQSKYLSLDASTYSQPVNTLILKTIFIYPLEIELEITRPDDGTKEKKKTTDMENFYEEINIQTDVYLKTMQYLEPICPAIVYATALDWKDPFLNFITRSYSPHMKQQLASYPGIKIGLIAMEIGISRTTDPILFNYIDTKPYYESYLPKALFTLINFVIQTGYNHGDFHSSNFLVNDMTRNYFWGRTGKTSIIDFGFAEKLPQEIYKKIKDLYNKKNYVAILDLLCDIPRKDGYNLNDWEGYTLMCLKTPPQLTDVRRYVVDKAWFNDQIDILFQQREEAINNLVRSFTAKKLPLSNNAKNDMYNGMHLEKEIITTIQPIASLNPFTEKTTKIALINTIISIINDIKKTFKVSFSDAEKIRICVKTIYTMHYIIYHLIYKLKVVSIDLNNLLFTAMIFTDVFKKIDNDFSYVAFLHCNVRTQGMCSRTGNSEPIDDEKIKEAINNGLFLHLEYYQFYCFIDYLSDEEVKKLTLTQIVDLFQSTKITNMSSTAIADELKTTIRASPSQTITIEKGFQELPFNEPETIVTETIESTNGDNKLPLTEPKTIVTETIASTNTLPRPPYVNQRFEGWPKMKGGKVKKTRRKQRKTKLRKTQRQKNRSHRR
jgi:hypothetical protein